MNRLKERDQKKIKIPWDREMKGWTTRSLESGEAEEIKQEVKCSGLRVKCCYVVMSGKILFRNNYLAQKVCRKLTRRNQSSFSWKKTKLQLFRKRRWPVAYMLNSHESCYPGILVALFELTVEVCDHCYGGSFTA